MRFVRQVGTAWVIVTSAACGGEALQEGLIGADTGGGQSSRAPSDDASIVLPRRGDATVPRRDADGGAPGGHDAGGTLRADAPTFGPDSGDRRGDAARGRSEDSGGTSRDVGSPKLPDSGPPDVSVVTILDSGSCNAGFHTCGGACVDDTAPATCGDSCTPCEAPANGVASCNGVACSYTCAASFVVCATGCCACGDTLTDPSNCGYCGHSCGSEVCVDGVCGSTVVATDQSNAYAIAADEQYVYWTTTGAASAVSQASVSGGGATVLFSGQNDYPAALAVVSGQVYWTDEIMSGAVAGVPIGGGMSIPVASDLAFPSALAAAGGVLYFTTNSFTSESGGAVLSVPTAGGSPLTVASGQTFGQYASVAVGGGVVYFTTYSDVVAAPASGNGQPTSFAPEQYPTAVAADATNVYWTSSLAGGVVLQQAASGGSAIVTLATEQYYPAAIAVDSQNVYWTSAQGGTGTVMSVPIGGGSAVTLASNQAYPAALALNSTTVFWVNFGDGTIHGVPK